MYLSSRKKEFEGENEEKRNVFGGGIQDRPDGSPRHSMNVGGSAFKGRLE
jgi:hypothetical protein